MTSFVWFLRGAYYYGYLSYASFLLVPLFAQVPLRLEAVNSNAWILNCLSRMKRIELKDRAVLLLSRNFGMAFVSHVSYYYLLVWENSRVDLREALKGDQASRIT